MGNMLPSCVFCKIAQFVLPADFVYQDEDALVFLDHYPVYKGHVLVIPRQHIQVVTDLSDDQVASFFRLVKRVTKAVEIALGADGSFVAMNNRVSQSVPHLHVHVVPRKKKDGLRGFFWPRVHYSSDEERKQICAQIIASM